MSLFVQITDQCKKDAQRYGYNEALESLVKKLEKDQNLALFDAFPPPYLVRKKFGDRQGRLIAARRDVSVDGVEHTIVILLSVLIRGDAAYDNQRTGFGHTPVEYGERHFVPVIQKLEPHLAALVRERTKTNPPPEKPALADAENLFLDTVVSSGLSAEDVLVCETKGWMDSLNVESELAGGLDKLILDIRRSIEQLYSMAEGGTLEPTGRISVPPNVESARVNINYEWNSQGRRLILLGLSREVSAAGAVAQKDVFRTYPAYMSIDDGLFLQLEKDTYGNLALSDEEQDVLHPGGQTPAFPMFINGRAGSGKSTILQYLFAEFYARFAKCGKPFDNPPAYFASSEDLIRKAREFVESILRTNPAYAQEESIKQALEDERVAFQGSFKVFRSHLLSLLTRDERASRFPEDRYVDYGKFIGLWESRFGHEVAAKRDFGPDISWHVIRTFIKGTSTDGPLEKDEYSLLPRDQKSVSPELFGLVYERVWESWYQAMTESEGWWDDQDLVRYLVAHDRFESDSAKFPGIFCDEAQDFTQLEIVAFLKMSAFSNRKLFPHRLSSLPFVFAGDEFQTLNPTGFRWDAVKGMFHEKFIRGLCPSAGSVELVAKDLLNNYRSVGQIVRFSNSVQLLRSVRFGEKSIRPQNEWGSETGSPVAFFTKDSVQFWDRIRERGDVQIIVPCHANEEVEFVKSDPILCDKIEIDEAKGTMRPNVLSAVRAKGLEYQGVAVYGFGDSLPDETLITRESGANWPNDAMRMTMEYFLNRLYVAVSRPRNQLYIVDSQQGVDRLWRYSETMEQIGEWSRATGRADLWNERTSSWVHGSIAMLEANYREDWPRLAEQDERAAEATRDASQMFTAANWYRYAGQNGRASLCEAKAYLYRGEFARAGELFQRNNEYGKAGDCYWEMGNADGWKKMCELSQVGTSIGGPSYVSATALVSNNPDSCLNALTFVLNAMEAESVSKYQTKAWRTALSELQRIVLNGNPGKMPLALELIDRIGRFGFVDATGLATKKALECGQYQRVKAWLERDGKKETKEYQIVLAKTEPYPANIIPIANAVQPVDEADTQLVTLYDANPEVPLATDEQKLLVGTALGRKGRKTDFCKIAAAMNEANLISLLNKWAPDEKTQRFLERLHTIITLAGMKTAEAVPAASKLSAEHRDRDFLVSVFACLGNKEAMSVFQASKSVQGPLFRFFDQFVDDWKSNPTLRYSVDCRAAGLAIECFGKRNAAVDFYAHECSSMWDARMEERLLACEWKKLQFNRKTMNSQKFIEAKKELEAKARNAGLKLDDIPELPETMSWEELKAKIIAKAIEESNPSSAPADPAPQVPAEPTKPSAPSEPDNPNPAPPGETDQAPEPSAPVSAAESAQVAFRQTSFTIDDRYLVEWWPKRNRVRITIKDPEAETDGDQWTLSGDGISGDGIQNVPAMESDEKPNDIQLPNTPFYVEVSKATGIRVFNIETGIVTMFATVNPWAIENSSSGQS